MALFQIEIEDELAGAVRDIIRKKGLDLPEAINLFLRETAHIGDIPFRASHDPFYNAENLEILRYSINQLNNGQVVGKTLDELRSREQ